MAHGLYSYTKSLYRSLLCSHKSCFTISSTQSSTPVKCTRPLQSWKLFWAKHNGIRDLPHLSHQVLRLSPDTIHLKAEVACVGLGFSRINDFLPSPEIPKKKPGTTKHTQVTVTGRLLERLQQKGFKFQMVSSRKYKWNATRNARVDWRPAILVISSFKTMHLFICLEPPPHTKHP